MHIVAKPAFLNVTVYLFWNIWGKRRGAYWSKAHHQSVIARRNVALHDPLQNKAFPSNLLQLPDWQRINGLPYYCYGNTEPPNASPDWERVTCWTCVSKNLLGILSHSLDRPPSKSKSIFYRHDFFWRTKCKNKSYIKNNVVSLSSPSHNKYTVPPKALVNILQG